MREIFAEHEEQPKAKLTRKKIVILGVILIAVAILVAVIAFVFLHDSKFEKVKDKAVQIAGIASTGKGYFTIDTYPDIYANMDFSNMVYGYQIEYVLLKDLREDALEAIKYANEALSFNASLYNRMLETSALMGRQSEENSKYKVSWTYHPDDGLEVTYEKK